jgi:hypothetical protein
MTARPFQQQRLERLARSIRKTPKQKKREAVKQLLTGLKILLELDGHGVSRSDV